MVSGRLYRIGQLIDQEDKMYHTMLLVALTGLPIGAEAEGSPAWQTNYTQAKKLCATENKPLAVFVGVGETGWNQLARDGKLGKDVEKTLSDKYLPVYVDSSTAAGRKLANALGITDKVGIAISDSKGEWIAFYHEGDLAKTALTNYLARYSDPSRKVEWTESNPGPGHETTYQSFYPAQPTFIGGGCPNCRR